MTVRPALFELRSGEAWRDPFPMYRGLRDHGLLITEMGAAIGQHTPNEVGVFLEETVDFVMHARDPETGLASDENRLP